MIRLRSDPSTSRIYIHSISIPLRSNKGVKRIGAIFLLIFKEHPVDVPFVAWWQIGAVIKILPRRLENHFICTVSLILVMEDMESMTVHKFPLNNLSSKTR